MGCRNQRDTVRKECMFVDVMCMHIVLDNGGKDGEISEKVGMKQWGTRVCMGKTVWAQQEDLGSL